MKRIHNIKNFILCIILTTGLVCSFLGMSVVTYAADIDSDDETEIVADEPESVDDTDEVKEPEKDKEDEQTVEALPDEKEDKPSDKNDSKSIEISGSAKDGKASAKAESSISYTQLPQREAAGLVELDGSNNEVERDDFIVTVPKVLDLEQQSDDVYFTLNPFMAVNKLADYILKVSVQGRDSAGIISENVTLENKEANEIRTFEPSVFLCDKDGQKIYGQDGVLPDAHGKYLTMEGKGTFYGRCGLKLNEPELLSAGDWSGVVVFKVDFNKIEPIEND